MRVLLVEPQYRRLGLREELEAVDTPTEQNGRSRKPADYSLWYPPLGLMKLARFHKDRGDEVKFISGCDAIMASLPDLFSSGARWDRVYIATLFTFNWDTIVRTISFYKQAVGGTVQNIFVGGIMASLMPQDLFEETGIYPITGILNSPFQIRLRGNEIIDQMVPDYEILDPHKYAINETYYAYTSRGCINQCAWCGVPQIEPTFVPYIDIKPVIRSLRERHGDKPYLKLMDNNVLASPRLEEIVSDLEELGYARNCITETRPPRQRIVDFNQGLDASYLDERRMKLISKLNVRPMRIAFDRASEKKQYLKAVKLAESYGVTNFSNYMLYNWKDSPRDLYERLVINIHLNEESRKTKKKEFAAIYSYPMRFAPIMKEGSNPVNRKRDVFRNEGAGNRNWLDDACWTQRFVRNVEIMKGAAHGAISSTPALAWRTIGKSYEEFLTNLYMPERLLRNRNKHERQVYRFEPKRIAGDGKVEDFRGFMLRLLRKNNERFRMFHSYISLNSTGQVRRAMRHCNDKEILQWLPFYLKD
jgi:hypothetical protein